MKPKIIHICWFGKDPYPLEIRMCLRTWKRLLPDYKVKVWDYDAAKAIGIKFIDDALEAKKWAFAADVVRFYAVWKEGGVYMDSDIFLYRRFDDIMDMGDFVTVNERLNPTREEKFGLQAAFFLGEQGNEFCRRMVSLYESLDFDETLKIMHDPEKFQTIISPYRMVPVAQEMGYKMDDTKTQHLEGLTVLPTQYLLPNTNKWPRAEFTIGMHRCKGSWRKKRKLGRRFEKAMKRYCFIAKYYLIDQWFSYTDPKKL